MNETMELLVAYGGILGLSSKEMSEIAKDAQSAVEDFRTAPPAECVLAASCGNDPKILWLGAVVYGYMISNYVLVDPEDGDVPQ